MTFVPKKMPDGSLYYTDPLGSMQMHRIAPGVLMHVVDGVSLDEYGAIVTGDCEREIRESGRVTVFVDAYESKVMATGFRDAMMTQKEATGG